MGHIQRFLEIEVAIRWVSFCIFRVFWSPATYAIRCRYLTLSPPVALTFQLAIPAIHLDFVGSFDIAQIERKTRMAHLFRLQLLVRVGPE